MRVRVRGRLVQVPTSLMRSAEGRHRLKKTSERSQRSAISSSFACTPRIRNFFGFGFAGGGLLQKRSPDHGAKRWGDLSTPAVTPIGVAVSLNTPGASAVLLITTMDHSF